jgi:hypothetical protein
MAAEVSERLLVEQRAAVDSDEVVDFENAYAFERLGHQVSYCPCP